GVEVGLAGLGRLEDDQSGDVHGRAVLFDAEVAHVQRAQPVQQLRPARDRHPSVRVWRVHSLTIWAATAMNPAPAATPMVTSPVSTATATPRITPIPARTVLSTRCPV